MLRHSLLALCCLAVGNVLAAGETPVANPPQPAILIVNGTGCTPASFADFDYFQRLNQRGFQLDVHFLDEQPPRPLTLDLLKKYNCLVILDLPPDEQDTDNWPTSWGKFPPYKKEMQPLLDAYLEKGGGIFLMPKLSDLGFRGNKKLEDYLERWGARLPYESVQDPASIAMHPRNMLQFVYTENIAKSPVSDGVKGMWFPGGDWMSYWSLPGTPLLVSKDWIEVVRGSYTSFTKDPMLPCKINQQEESYYKLRTRRPDTRTPPVLYAIREQGKGRLALTAIFPQFTIYGGTTWIHDGVILDKGLAGRPSDFGKLFENTLRWLSEPSLKSGALGGYAQNPEQLVHPNLRKKAKESYPQFDSYQIPAAPGTVYRGLIGARTRYSSGQGSVEEYAKAAKEAGLDFVVFLEEFGKKGGLTEAKYRQLEADCKRFTDDKIFLLPGFSFKNNIGNHQFAYGYDITWPTTTQFVGANGDELRHQCFDKDGKLALSDEDAKNWLWTIHGCAGRNVGYYNLADNAGVPVRNLRLFGILAVMTYIDGKLVEDLTPEYLDYVMDGDAPLAGVVELIKTPAELTRAVRETHYLTHVSANSLKEIPAAMQYGHQYGRANVNPSSGPRIKSWAGTQRVMTFAGEPFVPMRYRIRPLAWVTSDVGLKEIRIWDNNKVIRRFLLNGAKEFKQTFEWAYDRQRNLTLEVTDVQGHRALSAAFEMWCDANYHQWCSDRQNGSIWHGPGTISPAGGPGISGPGTIRTKSVGPTWDGGPPDQPCGVYLGNLGLRTKTESVAGPNEGNQFLTCVDDSVFNLAIAAGHNYAPGSVANAYHTLGPINPNPLMSGIGRTTLFIQRPAGPSLTWYPMWVERAGGWIILFEGEVTLKKDTELADMELLQMRLLSFPADGRNIPIFGLRRSNKSISLCGPKDSFWDRNAGFRPAVGVMNDLDDGKYVLDSGGYTAMMPSGAGNQSIFFNMSDRPMRFHPEGFYSLAIEKRPYKAGETIRWQHLLVVDPLDQPAHNLARAERIRRYYGLDGTPGSGLVIKRGKLLKHFGVVDIAPEKGIVEFEAPAPDFALDLPLGLRFIGFNPHWTVGQFQIEGYSTGFYTNGKNVYRNLAMDDRDMAYLAVYPDNVPLSHSIVGHPVQCDNPELVIEFAQLNTKPFEYHVAVNNPTDAPIKTTLKKCMDLPGLEFPDTAIEAPAGGYLIIKDK